MTVEAIFVASARGEPQQLVEAVRAVVGRGIEGDRNFGKRRYVGQNITFVAAEEIEYFRRQSGLDIALGDTRRNIVTRGVQLSELIDKEFSIGDARFRGIELCEPCAKLGARLRTDLVTASAVVRLFVHRAGIRADVIATGTIRIGDEVRLCPTPPPR